MWLCARGGNDSLPATECRQRSSAGRRPARQTSVSAKHRSCTSFPSPSGGGGSGTYALPMICISLHPIHYLCYLFCCISPGRPSTTCPSCMRRCAPWGTPRISCRLSTATAPPAPPSSRPALTSSRLCVALALALAQPLPVLHLLPLQHSLLPPSPPCWVYPQPRSHRA